MPSSTRSSGAPRTSAAPRASAAPRTRRTDPDRRDRIIDACLDVVAEHGVAGTTHRKVAVAADVPLGSMTYHFEGMDELLRLAFERFSQAMSQRFEDRMAAVTTREEALDAVTAIISDDVFTDDRELVLTHELYTFAARRPEYRTLTRNWMAASRRALERHFDPATARLIDAAIEGLTIHQAFDPAPRTQLDVPAVVRQIAAIHASDAP
ncbi:TetR/AcrR family transcriptional regulator [Serinibacter arcticus]|uniref:Putative transcriptional regulator, TetR family n=1 Tax=Serinibacter arcticus TaxID=1655435 RepID=A0A4Z1E0W9_9MICO|nr:TetR family transcriptional regulator [Serinibacter arcticus]TGO04889.1 putative transcriptional regulator, TetR family [Serinibacter arcticus]